MNKCTDTPQRTKQLHSGKSDASRKWTHIWSNISAYTRQSRWNPDSNTPESDRPRHDRPAACYRPAVFFRHLRLVALSSPQGKCGTVRLRCYLNACRNVCKIVRRDY